MATTKATTLAHTLGGISSDISTAEINRLDGVTGDLQTQLNAKLATATASSTYAPLASPTFTGSVTLPDNPTVALGSNANIGDAVTYSVGWQHIDTKSCPTNVDSISFAQIFTDDYVAFDFEMALEGSGSNCSFYIQFLDNSNSEISDNEYFSTLRWYPNNTGTTQLGYHANQTYARLIHEVPNSSGHGGFRGTMRVRNVSAPTLGNEDTDRGTYRPDIYFTGTGYLDGKYSHAMNYIRFNNDRQENTIMGIKIFMRDSSNFSQARNFYTGSWITCFGLKGKST